MWIAEWQWDDANVGHIARHGLFGWDVVDVARQSPRFRRNKKGRAAAYQMVGPDSGGRFLAVFITPVAGSPGVWRAVTARAATAAEKQWWETA